MPFTAIKKQNYCIFTSRKAKTMKNIGETIKFHRKKAGLSRIQLAEIAGVGKNVIFDIEHGKQTVKLDTLSKILDSLNIHIKLESPLMEAYNEKSIS